VGGIFKRNKNAFVKLFWSYIIIIIVPVIVIGIVTISVLFSRLAADTKKLNIGALEQSKRIIDTHLKSVITVLYQLNQSERIAQMTADMHADSNAGAYDLWRITNEIKVYLANNSIVENVGIYLRNKDIVIDKNSAYTLEEYYEKFLNISSYSYEVWFEKMSRQSGRPFFVTGKSVLDENENISIFCWELDIANKTKGGMFIAIINRNMILEILDNLEIASDWDFVAVENQGGIIASTENFGKKLDLTKLHGRAGELKVGKDIIVYRSSEVMDFKYIFVFPLRGLAGNVWYITIIFLILLLLSVAASVYAANLNAKRIQKPILEVFDQNKILERDLLKQVDSAREEVLMNLLNNIKLNKTDETKLFSTYLSRFTNNTTRVIAIGISNFDERRISGYSDETGAAWREVNEIIGGFLKSEQIAYYRIRHNNASYLYVLNYNNSVEHILGKMVNEFKSNYNIALNIGAGDEVSDITKLSKSYDGAAQAIRYGLRKKIDGIVYYHNIKMLEGSKIFYTAEKELSVIKNIKAGEAQTVGGILDEIYDVNFNEKQLSISTLRRLILSLTLTVYKVLEDLYSTNDEKYEKYNRVCVNVLRNENLEEGFNILREICTSLSLDFAKQGGDNELKTQIKEFVNEKYTDINFSLDVLADYIGVSYHYLSRLFKEFFGSNFVNYLNTLRLEKAKELLGVSNMTVEQIAKQTGFSTSNSFIKTFKRYYSVTPGKYLKDSNRR